jgi:hypothetical protein
MGADGGQGSANSAALKLLIFTQTRAGFFTEK